MHRYLVYTWTTVQRGSARIWPDGFFKISSMTHHNGHGYGHRPTEHPSALKSADKMMDIAKATMARSREQEVDRISLVRAAAMRVDGKIS